MFTLGAPYFGNYSGENCSEQFGKVQCVAIDNPLVTKYTSLSFGVSIDLHHS